MTNSKRIRMHNQTTAFDCQSLESSLKRVRLSCSPGELRLLRDLKSLNWDILRSDQWRKGSVRLTQVHPLRLLLEWKQQRRLWIQIPRRYPHKPPVISRLEGWSEIEQILITEAPPMSSQGHKWDPSCNDLQATCPPSTRVYSQWSPIRHLQDLLDYLLLLELNPRHPIPSSSEPIDRSWTPPCSFPPSLPVSPRRTDCRMHEEEDGMSSSMVDSSVRMSDTTTTNTNVNTTSSRSTPNIMWTGGPQGSFPPNRFDQGYIKFNHSPRNDRDHDGDHDCWDTWNRASPTFHSSP